MGAIYLGVDASAPLADLTGMTYSCTVAAGWEGSSADAGAVNLPLSESSFLDGNKDHKNNSSDALSTKAPIGSSLHWATDAEHPVLSAVWTADLGAEYSIEGLTLYGSRGNTYWGMLRAVVQVSTDGVQWTQVGSTAGRKNNKGRVLESDTTDLGPWVQDAGIAVGTVGRYVRITASDWQGAGGMKVDEMDLFITAVPEPAALGVLGIGMALMAWRRR